MKKKYYLLSALLLFICVFAFPQKTEASVKKLSPGVSYSTKLTGSKKYTVKYTQPKVNAYYNDFKLYIDGKKVKSYSGKKYESDSYDVYLGSVAKNRTLIIIRPHCDSGIMPFIKLYEYKRGKLKTLLDFCSLTRCSSYEKANRVMSHWARARVRDISTGRIVLTWEDQTPATGNVALNVAYKVSGTTITKIGVSSEIRVSASNMQNPLWTANREMKGKSSPGSGTTSLKVKKGQKVTLKAMTSKNGKRYMLLIAADGSKGWVFVPKYTDTDPLKITDSQGQLILGYFKECKFIG